MFPGRKPRTVASLVRFLRDQSCVDCCPYFEYICFIYFVKLFIHNRRIILLSVLCHSWKQSFMTVDCSQCLIYNFFVLNHLKIFLNFIFCFIFVCVGSSLLHTGFSLVAASGGYSSLRCAGFSCGGFSLWSMGSRHAGFDSCGTRVQQLWLAVSRAQAQQLWRTGLVAPQHVGSSQTRAQTRVPCLGRGILNH